MASAEPRETLGALWEWGWACMMDLGRAFFWRAPPSPPSITSWDSEDPGHLWSGFSPSTSALAGKDGHKEWGGCHPYSEGPIASGEAQK